MSSQDRKLFIDDHDTIYERLGMSVQRVNALVVPRVHGGQDLAMKLQINLSSQRAHLCCLLAFGGS
jgi:hypothetical protein